MLAEQDYKQNHHGHPSTESRRDGRPLHSQFRKAETSENQGIVAYYIQHIHHHRHQHRIHCLVGAAQRSGKSKRQCLEKGERPYNTHIIHAVLHQFGPQPHQPQDRLRTPEQQHADTYTHHEVHQNGYPTTCTTCLCSRAPIYCEHSTEVPRLITSNTRKVSMII